jgi:hypothetical protein
VGVAREMLAKAGYECQTAKATAGKKA